MHLQNNLFAFLIFTLFILGCQHQEEKQSHFPIPTDGKTIVNELGEADAGEKEAWFAALHSAAPSVDWKAIEAETAYKKYIQRIENRSQATSRDNAPESFINGTLIGQWNERGSNDQSGSLGPTDYDVANDVVYSVSAGGIIWKGPSDGSNWEPINEDLKFSWNLLRVIPFGGGNRILAMIGKSVYYSDDDGVTWMESNGLDTYSNNWGSREQPFVLNDAQNTIYLLVREWNPTPWAPEVYLYKSVDQGINFTQEHSFGDVGLGTLRLFNPYNSNDLYVLEKVTNTELKTYKINTSTGNLDLLNTNTVIDWADWGNFSAMLEGGTTHLYTYDNNTLYHSSDDGEIWTDKGALPSSPWGIGISVSATDPDRLFMGNIEAYRTYNGGTSWTLVNGWAEYYGDPLNKLHADMMRFNYFQKTDGTDFMLISNHGGISISEDDMTSNTNISMAGLNVSQYYSVATDPINQSHIYAGAQDQGFQRAPDAAGILDFDQAISGDYGHIVFNDDGGLWTVYPGGWVSYWDQPETQGIQASTTIDSDNEAAWIPFLMESPYANATTIYMAGGSASGGTGSFIIELEYTGGNNINVSNHSTANFHSLSGGGVISAIEVSPLDEDNWFVGTSNGKFYYSTDGGINWTETVSFDGPGQHYLYGATILASNQDQNVVYFGGSGYSNSPVYKSEDGGVTFNAMSTGLPSTLVFKLVQNPTGTLLFAATESGPYVCDLATNQWHDLSGDCTPNQTYWSVEYVPNLDIVRFGTYGRGIWDFNITEQPLPVELSSFTARPINNDYVQLNWQTVSEDNNDFFEIERSADGKEFEALQKVQGAGTSTLTNNYEAKDSKPYNGVSYYRLLQQDIDGTKNYSESIAVTIETGDKWTVYPNPIHSGQALHFKNLPSGELNFELYDANGKLIRQYNLNDQVQILLPSLSNGNYFYTLSKGQQRVNGKLSVVN